MADEIKVDPSNAKEVIDNLHENIEAYKATLKYQVFRALTLVEKEIKNQIRQRSGLKRRTGRLLNTWGENKQVIESGNNIIGILSSMGVPYAAIQEFGGTITPKSAKALVFPTEENRRADGSPRVSLKELFTNINKFERVWVTKNGVVMWAKLTKSGRGKNAVQYTKVTPMFLFKQRVNIPAHPYIRPALAATQDIILKNFGLFLSATFKPKGDK